MLGLEVFRKDSLIVLVCFLFIGSLFSPVKVSAPLNGNSEKIRVDGVYWDSSAEEFVVSMSCKYGFAKRSSHANYKLSTTIEVNLGNVIVALNPLDWAIQKQEGAAKSQDGFIKIEPQRIPWDRNGGAAKTSEDVKVIIQVKNPSDEILSRAEVVYAGSGIEFQLTPRLIYVVNSGDNTVSVVNGTLVEDGIPDNEVIDTITLGFDGCSNSVDVDESRGLVYVAGMKMASDNDRVSVIDESAVNDGIIGNEVVETLVWDVDPYPPLVGFFDVHVCEYHQVIWVAASNVFGVLAFDGVSRELMQEGEILLQAGLDPAIPMTVDLDETRSRVYVAAAGVNKVFVIDEYRLVDGIFNNEVVASIAVGDAPFGIAVDQSRNRVYVSNQGDDTVSVIDGSRILDKILGNEVIAIIPVGDSPAHIALDINRNLVYVSNQHDDTVTVIEGSRLSDKVSGNEVIDTIIVGDTPLGISVDETNNRIYVANNVDDTVSVINGYLINDGVPGNEVIATIAVGDNPSGVATSNPGN